MELALPPPGLCPVLILTRLKSARLICDTEVQKPLWGFDPLADLCSECWGHARLLPPVPGSASPSSSEALHGVCRAHIQGLSLEGR